MSATNDLGSLYIRLVHAYDTKEDVEASYPISHVHHNETVRIPNEAPAHLTFWSEQLGFGKALIHSKASGGSINIHWTKNDR